MRHNFFRFLPCILYSGQVTSYSSLAFQIWKWEWNLCVILLLFYVLHSLLLKKEYQKKYLFSFGVWKYFLRKSPSKGENILLQLKVSFWKQHAKEQLYLLLRRLDFLWLYAVLGWNCPRRRSEDDGFHVEF